jgi:coenzyme F420 biosynthesis associated uncharacterized protein
VAADPIAWDLAERVAARVGGREPLAESYHVDSLERDFAELTAEAEALVAEETGLVSAAGPARARVTDRRGWVRANLASFRRLLKPLTERLGDKMSSNAAAAGVTRTLTGIEVGTLLGWMSTRVLGQYDLLVPENDKGAAPLYFVGPNLVETERRHGFVPDDFSLWVAVHEVTHRFQFEGVPWLRARFLGLVHSYLSSLELDAKGLAQRLGTAARKMISKETPVEERNPIYLLATDEQRDLLDQIQSLMAVVEGHGNYVMDAVGEAVIPSFPRMRHTFQRRRHQTTWFQKILNQAIGLEMKMRQYEVGQQFCETVARLGGRDALAQLWVDPDRFPSMNELREPEKWLSRVAA